MEYYALVYLSDTINDPSGLIRRDKAAGILEKFNRETLKWEHDPDVIGYFTGEYDEAELITEKSANVLIGLWLNSAS